MNKSKISFLIDMFAKLTTAIFLFSSLYIAIFNGINTSISFSYIWGVLGLSFLLTVAFIPLIPEKEISRKRLLICNICYFIFADVVVLGFGLLLNWFSLQHPVTIVAMEITFIVISIAVYLIMYFSAKNSAAKMNEQLKKMKQANDIN